MIRFLRHIYITQEMENGTGLLSGIIRYKNGVQRVDSEGIAPDYTGPWDMTLGYLPYYMQGMDMGVLKTKFPTPPHRWASVVRSARSCSALAGRISAF